MRHLIFFLFVLTSCQRDFLSNISKVEVNNAHCNSADTCFVGLDLMQITDNHDTTHRCVFVVNFYCAIDRCDTLDCDDLTLCTDDHCDNKIGCFYRGGCDDNNICTTNDCVMGQCVFTMVDCSDNIPCTIDACVPQDGLCEHMDTCAITCDTVSDPNYYDPFTGLESFCKLIVCGQNTVRSCDDGDACTNDYCVEGLRECVNSDVNCDDGSDCVTTGMCWCDNGYCVYGSGKRIAVDEVKRMQAEQNLVTEQFLYSIDGKLLAVILRDRVKEFAMLFVHSDYPSGMYLLKSGSRTTKLIKP